MNIYISMTLFINDVRRHRVEGGTQKTSVDYILMARRGRGFTKKLIPWKGRRIEQNVSLRLLKTNIS